MGDSRAGFEGFMRGFDLLVRGDGYGGVVFFAWNGAAKGDCDDARLFRHSLFPLEACN